MLEPDVLIPLAIEPVLPPRGSVLHEVNGTSMGCTWRVHVVAPPGALLALHGQLQGQLDEVVAQMSHWDDSSQLARFNRAPAGSWHALPEAFFTVLSYALDLAEASGGAYDPGAGALVNAWGFGAEGRYNQPGFTPPSAARIDALLAERRPIALDREHRRAMQPGGVQLDFSAIAKGYAVDRMAHLLQARGWQHFLVELGGELRGAGIKPDGQPWWVEIELPPGAATAGPPVRVALHGLALATSGDYRRTYQDEDGACTRAHTIDPRSGAPLDNGVASVSVLHPECMAADALSTALSVLGPLAGLAFADAHAVAARWLVRSGTSFYQITSAAWRAMLR